MPTAIASATAYNTERAALARHEAEQALARTLVFPEELQIAAEQDERVKHAMLKETALFEAGATRSPAK